MYKVEVGPRHSGFMKRIDDNLDWDSLRQYDNLIELLKDIPAQKTLEDVQSEFRKLGNIGYGNDGKIFGDPYLTKVEATLFEPEHHRIFIAINCPPDGICLGKVTRVN